MLGAQQLLETIWQFASKTDEETLRILRDTIILAAHANPDGMELVSDWYMRKPTPTERSTGQIPRLYQKYVGHDNNRDFYAMNQPESTNINRVLYREWYPQIVYNHHQTGPTGTVMFSPPFRDPFNYAYDPLVINTLDQVGAAMHARFDAEGKPGVTTRSGSNYSTWWNGGLRTMVYFHNQVGLLTETIGNPTPEQIGFVPDRLIPRGDYAAPIAPQTWHFRQSVDYSLTANYAVLDFAQRYRETLLYNIYLMGRNAIRRGSTDTWTDYPKRVAQVKAEIARDMKTEASDPRMVAGGRAQTVPAKYFQLLRKPEWRDARAYVVPADRGDFLTSTRFVNALIKAGVVVHRATGPFSAGGTQYPAGSFVVKAAQAFGPHVLDMFEPQDHPNDFQYPGGPPIPPYDNAGWTLAFQMGVVFDRHLETVDGPLEALTDLARPAPGTVSSPAGTTGYAIAHKHNDAFIVVNRLLKAGDEVYFVADRRWQSTDGTGAIYVPARPSTAAVLQKAATDLGISAVGVTARPGGTLHKLRKPRIGLWDQYGGSMPSGHVRWLLEQFEFDFEVVFPQTLDAGNLNAKYDVLLFPDGGIPENAGGGGGFFGRQPKAEEIPEQYRRASRQRDDRQDRATPQAVRRGRRRAGGVRRLRGARASSWSAGARPSGRGHAGWRRARAAARQVLRAGFDPAGGGGQHVAARIRLRDRGRRAVRKQSGAGAGPERRARGRAAGGVVRRRAAAAVRLGVGSALPPRRGRRGRCLARQGPGAPVRPGDHVPRPAARHVQVPVQQHLRWHRRVTCNGVCHHHHL